VVKRLFLGNGVQGAEVLAVRGPDVDFFVQAAHGNCLWD
jgi:hypothetical protein